MVPNIDLDASMAPEVKYMYSIMEALRQRKGLEEDDNTKDAEIDAMSPAEVFDECCNWNGLIHYGSILRDWVEDIYEIKLDNLPTRTPKEGTITMMNISIMEAELQFGKPMKGSFMLEIDEDGNLDIRLNGKSFLQFMPK